MKTPKPAGGWASRSTSSFSATIWSRASLRVDDQALVLGGDRGEVGLQVGDPLLEHAALAGRLGESPAQGVDLVPQRADLRIQVVAGDAG